MCIAEIFVWVKGFEEEKDNVENDEWFILSSNIFKNWFNCGNSDSNGKKQIQLIV
jgi:hypothetical protein